MPESNNPTLAGREAPTVEGLEELIAKREQAYVYYEKHGGGDVHGAEAWQKARADVRAYAERLAGYRPGGITSIDEMCAILKEHYIKSDERTDCALLYRVTFDQLRALYDRGRAVAGAAEGTKEIPNDPECTCGNPSPRAYNHAQFCPHSTPWNERVKARLAAEGAKADQPKGGA